MNLVEQIAADLYDKGLLMSAASEIRARSIIADRLYAAPAPAQQPETQRAVLEARIEGIKSAIKCVRTGRTQVNFGHIPSVSRALDWVWQDLEGIVDELQKELTACTELAHTSPEPAEIIRQKTAELEAEGVCKWQYPCPYCLEGNTPIRSSVTDAMVHHTSVGRVLCAPRDKPVSFGVAPEPAEPSTPLYEKWAASLPKCIGYEGGCDGDLVGTEHERNCPMFDKNPATLRDAFNAGLAARSPETSMPLQEILGYVKMRFAKDRRDFGLGAACRMIAVVDGQLKALAARSEAPVASKDQATTSRE